MCRIKSPQRAESQRQSPAENRLFAALPGFFCGPGEVGLLPPVLPAFHVEAGVLLHFMQRARMALDGREPVTETFFVAFSYSRINALRGPGPELPFGPRPLRPAPAAAQSYGQRRTGSR